MPRPAQTFRPEVILHAFLQDNDAIQAFLPDTPDHPFSMSVGVGRPVWCFDYLKSLALEDRIEFAAEFAVPVVDEEPRSCRRVLNVPTQVARLLGDPEGVWTLCAAGDMQSPASNLYEEQHVLPGEKSCLNGKKVTRPYEIPIVPQELSPAGSCPERPPSESIARRYSPYGSLRDIDSQLLEFTLYLAITPGWILFREIQDKVSGFPGMRWSAGFIR